METPVALHERIVKHCAEAINLSYQSQTYQFEFVMGDSFELNNDSDNEVKPVVTLEFDSAIDVSKELDKVTVTCTIGFLFLSRLDDLSSQRSVYYDLAQNAYLIFLKMLRDLRVNSLGNFVFQNNFEAVGKKVLFDFQVGQGFRAKNKYSSNRDGIIVPNFKLVFQNPTGCYE